MWDSYPKIITMKKNNSIYNQSYSIFIAFFILVFAPDVICAQIVNGVDYSALSIVYKTFDMYNADIFGQRFPSENYTYIDEVTGTKINALTTSRNHNEKMYQTHPQWTSDGKYVVITSDRTSTKEKRDRQAYAISMDNFEIVQITTGKPIGRLHLGWHKNAAWYFRENKLIELNLGKLLADSEKGTVTQPDDYETILGIVPDTTHPRELGLDANENRAFFCARIGTFQPNEKWRPMGESSSAIYCMDFKTGKTEKILEAPFTIGHIQSNPYVTGELMYCWETGGDSPQRMWYMKMNEDGTVDNKAIYKEKDNDWVTHEVFMGPDNILFHLMGHIDRLNVNKTGLYSLNVRTNKEKFHGQTTAGGYWHCNATPDKKRIVADTFDGRLYRINYNDSSDTVLLTQGHRPNSNSPFTNEAHLHPSVSPDGKWVLINSSRFTECDVLLLSLFP